MPLVNWEIEQAVMYGRIGINPYNQERVQPNSYDVCLGNDFQVMLPGTGEDSVVSPFDRGSIVAAFQHVSAPYIIIEPGQLILGTTMERLSLPNDIVAFLTGKSSLGRLGLDIHKTAGWVDAGFVGELTLELHNCGQRSILLKAGMPIGQLVFFDGACASYGYCEKADAKYANQKGATISRYSENDMAVVGEHPDPDEE